MAPVPRQHVVLRPSPARTRRETHECLDTGTQAGEDSASSTAV